MHRTFMMIITLFWGMMFAQASLTGVTWRLVELNHSAENIRGYWFKFTNDTSATAHMECNECFYRYTIEDQSVIFVPRGCTVRACFEANREAALETAMRQVKRWSISGFQLFLMDSTDTLMAFADPAASNLTGRPWFLQSFKQTSGRTLVPDPENYTVYFKDDGVVSVKADCNSCGGTYSENAGASSLSISALACTKMLCGSDSKGDLFAGTLSRVNGYLRASDTLYCFADADTLVFTGVSAAAMPKGRPGSVSVRPGIDVRILDRRITVILKSGTIARARLLDTRGRQVREFERIRDNHVVFSTLKIHSGTYVIQAIAAGGKTMTCRVFIP